MEEKNWAGNIVYGAAELKRPRTLDELQDAVGEASGVRALGSRHSFNTIAATPGTLVSLDRFDDAIEIDSSALTVRVDAGVTYGILGQHLQQQGFALANLASLPHISVAGATATATHGSGDRNGTLATSVRSLEVVQADGSVIEVSRGDDRFGAYVVGLGAFGVISRLTLDIEPTFAVAVTVFEELQWDDLYEHFDEISSAAYSVSLFTNWANDTVDQVWLKQRIGRRAAALQLDSAPPSVPAFFSARAATVKRHPLPGVDPEACMDQLGQPGAWIDRLAHFRLDFTPSNGDELQSEYLIGREHAVPAFEALRGLGDRIRPLLQISEIRTVAADPFWLSMSQGRDSVCLHFTWKPLESEVEGLLPDLERALAPFAARPHWGKVFAASASDLTPLYERMPDFVALAEAADPEQKFRNDFLRAKVFGA